MLRSQSLQFVQCLLNRKRDILTSHNMTLQITRQTRVTKRFQVQWKIHPPKIPLPRMGFGTVLTIKARKSIELIDFT
jgi:hypothetical protein